MILKPTNECHQILLNILIKGRAVGHVLKLKPQMAGIQEKTSANLVDGLLTTSFPKANFPVNKISDKTRT